MVDTVLQQTGRWQVALLLLIGCNYAIVALNHALPAFHGFTPSFHCQDNELDNSTQPIEGCLVEDQECSGGYKFESARHDKTIVTEWQLVCDRRLLRPLVATLYFCGVTLGALAGGLAADRYGRKPVMLGSLYLQGALGLGLYATYSLEAFIAVRFLQGFFIQCLQGSTYTLVMELFPPSARTAVGVVMEVYWALGLTVLTCAAFLLPDWRAMQLALTVPTALTLFYVCFVPESARWLSTRGRHQEATKVLERIKRLNGRSTSPSNDKPTITVESAESDQKLNPAYHSNNHLQIIDNCNIISAIQEKRGSSNKNDKLYTRISEQVGGSGLNKVNQSSDVEKNVLNGVQNTNCSNGLPVDVRVQTTSEVSVSTVPAADIAAELDPKDVVVFRESTVRKGKGETSHIAIVNPSRKHGLLDLFTSNVLRKTNVIMIFVWFSVSLAYYGIMFYLPDLSGDRHLNFLLGAVLEVTSYGLAYLVLSRYGRRIPLVVYLTVSGALCAAVGAIGAAQGVNPDSSMALLQTALALLGKGAVVSAFCTIFIYTAELFPTVVRAAAMGHCGFWGRVGSLLAPQLLLLGEYTAKVVPLICMSVLVILAGLATLALPETFRIPLADTIQEAEDRQKQRKNIGKISS